MRTAILITKQGGKNSLAFFANVEEAKTSFKEKVATPGKLESVELWYSDAGRAKYKNFSANAPVIQVGNIWGKPVPIVEEVKEVAKPGNGFLE